MLTEKILQSLREDCGYSPSEPLVVGLSGGADSLALAHCLWQAGLPLIIGHFDHQLRLSSAQEAAQVQALAQSWEVPCAIGQADVRTFARQNRLGIEEAARVCRYQFLLSLAKEHSAAGVAVAHTADDQVETVLMHFLRGSGINGLRGMQAVSFLKELNPLVPIFRPMLAVTHAEALAYCQEHSLPYLSDESNLDPAFFRNRLRLQVIPTLEEVSPAFRQVVLRNTLVLQSDAGLLEHLEGKAFAACVQSQTSERIQLNKADFLGLQEGLQRRVLMHALSQLVPNLRNIGYEAVERVRRAILSGQKRADFLAKVVVWVDEKTIQIGFASLEPDFAQFPQLPAAEESLAFHLQHPLELANGWRLQAELVSRKTFTQLPSALKKDPFQAWLNPADLSLPLEVRGMRQGERWAPLGMQGRHQKLSDFFINEKIPQGARAKWPLVLSEGSLLWVCGLRIAQAWRLIGDEPEILHLQLIKPQA